MFLLLTFAEVLCINWSIMAIPQGPFYQTLGQRLREARRSVNLTQGDLARAVGVSRTSITNIETGRQPLYVHTLLRFAEILGITASELIPARKAVAPESDLAVHLKQLEQPKRDWVARIIETPVSAEERQDGTTVHSGTTTSSRTSEGSANKKSTHTHRKAGRAN